MLIYLPTCVSARFTFDGTSVQVSEKNINMSPVYFVGLNRLTKHYGLVRLSHNQIYTMFKLCCAPSTSSTVQSKIFGFKLKFKKKQNFNSQTITMTTVRSVKRKYCINIVEVCMWRIVRLIRARTRFKWGLFTTATVYETYKLLSNIILFLI